jgi:hypothetical protein
MGKCWEIVGSGIDQKISDLTAKRNPLFLLLICGRIAIRLQRSCTRDRCVPGRNVSLITLEHARRITCMPLGICQIRNIGGLQFGRSFPAIYSRFHRNQQGPETESQQHP